MLTMPPGALQGQQQSRPAGPPKVVGELLKGAGHTTVVEGTTVARKRVVVTEQSSGAPAAAAMVLAKDMATGRKSSGGSSTVATVADVPQSPRAGRSSGIPIRPKPVPPSVYRKRAIDDSCSRKRLPKSSSPRPTSVDRVKV